MVKEITKCRICGNTELISIINLGELSLTGVFPKSKEEKITTGPLELVKCNDEHNKNACGLVQLRHSYDKNELYGNNYGYRSGLNNSMVSHLKDIANKCLKYASLDKDDIIIDIGSNDGTLLGLFPENQYLLIGIDPTANKFRRFYKKEIKIIPEFFSSEIINRTIDDKKAKIITSIAMFYDLESPIDFAKQVYEILHDEGIWVLEQSYLVSMIEQNAYDIICHEHIEYYGVKQINWILKKVGMKIIDIEINDINGGSFYLIVAKESSKMQECTSKMNKFLTNEKKYQTLAPYENFKQRIKSHKTELLETIGKINKNNKHILGYGASTKGNVILQYCGITSKDIPYIAEVNEDKFGCYTPKTHIPIISEKDAKAKNPDYFMVLPWHFKQNIIQREEEFLKRGGKLIFPLPQIEIV